MRCYRCIYSADEKCDLNLNDDKGSCLEFQEKLPLIIVVLPIFLIWSVITTIGVIVYQFMRK